MTQNIEISVNLSPELRLEQALKQAGIEDPATVSKLTVSGMLKNDDFKYMKKNMSETLQELDMGDASFYRNKIHNNAFEGCSGLTSIIIPNTVVKIGIAAFWGTGLTSVTIPKSVKKISGFNSCSSDSKLTAINVHPENPNYSSENGVLFNKNKTELIEFPAGKSDCGNEYIIPETVVKIGYNAFLGCSGLTSIVIPDTVTEIGKWAFSCTGLTSVIIPNSVAKIEHDTFSYCLDLKSIFIPNSVKEIDWFAFRACHALTAVTIPKSVTVIHKKAFYDCPAFFTVHPNNHVYKSVNGKIEEIVEKTLFD